MAIDHPQPQSTSREGPLAQLVISGIKRCATRHPGASTRLCFPVAWDQDVRDRTRISDIGIFQDLRSPVSQNRCALPNVTNGSEAAPSP